MSFCICISFDYSNMTQQFFKATSSSKINSLQNFIYQQTGVVSSSPRFLSAKFLFLIENNIRKDKIFPWDGTKGLCPLRKVLQRIGTDWKKVDSFCLQLSYKRNWIILISFRCFYYLKTKEPYRSGARIAKKVEKIQLFFRSVLIQTREQSNRSRERNMWQLGRR